MVEKIQKKKLLSSAGICGFGLLVYLLSNNYSQPSSNSSLDSYRELDVVHHDLEFVHITKTGGTTIERVGCEHGFKWGSMHYAPYFGCADPDISSWKGDKRDYANVSPWHTPPKILEKLVDDKENPFKGSELFTIVRNPYTRFVSEYHCPFAGYKGPEDKTDPAVMNKWIQDMIDTLVKHKHAYILKVGNSDTPEEVKRDVLGGKHFLNQVDYVYNDEGDKIIDHVLRYENMEEDFNNLMEEFNYNVTLPKKDEMGTYGTKGPKTSFKDLDIKSINKINRWAGPDFVAFGYNIIQRHEHIKNEHEYDTDVRPHEDMEYDPTFNFGICNEFRIKDSEAGMCKRIQQ
eukprot:CAMPEP_0194111158 /NCGR_PEP_ID=MMETSP0150-20130528/10226_1 /TAXON_ID=122233 /ORGANISM="Chaetoceros debilis, Strain MM31A-1" /LENGTH=344 /DNA_ID=CAMNT_0038800517 /DNA_START=97 /DNA_END=1131 /DNA_ORIENTATION=+